MADWSLPTLSDLKVDVMAMFKGREVDAYTLAENPTNPPVGAKRWNASLNKFQSWNGTAWVDLVISIAGGGTGASDINGFLDNFNLGSMALQNSNAVTITGGTIAGLTSLHVAGNTHLAGIVSTGSAPTTLTNSAGQILETAIADGTIYARNAANEIITGLWTFSSEIHAGLNIRILPNGTSAGLNRISFSDAVNSELPAYIQAYEPGLSGNHLIISNNYYGIDGGSSGRRNLSIGGSFLRLGRTTVNLVGIDAAGNYLAFLGAQPGYVTASQPNFQVGTSTGTVVLQLLSNNLSYFQFMTNGTQTAAIGHGGGVTYYDSNSHTWRNNSGATLYASLDTTGKFSAYGIQTNNGYYYGSGGSTGVKIFVTGDMIQKFADRHYMTNANGNTHLAYLNTARYDIYVERVHVTSPTSRLIVGGEDGIGMSMWKAGTSAVFACHQGSGTAGETNWHNAANTEQLMILKGNSLTAHGGFSGNAGTPQAASFRFVQSPNSGMYYNLANGTIEFGSQLDTDAHRAVIRCRVNVGGQIDFLIGNSVMYTMGPFPNHRIAGHFSPNSTPSYYCGEPTLAWYQVHSYHGYVTISDIRSKDAHGPIRDDILDLIESVEPFIASSKESDYDEEHKLIPKEDFLRKFPTLSAQDIREKIDGPLGVKTVFGEEKLGIEYGRLTPLLWAAIRRLNARLKALEEN